MQIRKKWLNQLKTFFNKHFWEYYLASFCWWILSSCENHCTLIHSQALFQFDQSDLVLPSSEYYHQGMGHPIMKAYGVSIIYYLSLVSFVHACSPMRCVHPSFWTYKHAKSAPIAAFLLLWFFHRSICLMYLSVFGIRGSLIRIWIRILLFLAMAFKMPTKNELIFCLFLM